MSNLSYIRPLGIWLAGVPVKHEELTLLDQQLFKAPNFAEGGAYAPSSPIYIGGSGVQLKIVGSSTLDTGALLNLKTGSFCTVESGASFSASTGSTANFAGQVYFSAGSNTDVFGLVRIRGEAAGTLVADTGSFVTLNGTVTVGGVATFAQSATFTNGFNVPAGGAASSFFGTVVFTGLTDLAGNTQILAPAALKSTLTASGAGRVVKRTSIIATAGGAAISGYGPANCDNIIVRALTADTGLYIDGGVDGDEMTIVNKSSSHLLQIFDGVNFVFLLKNLAGGSNFRSVHVVRVAGAWEVLRAEAALGGY